MNKRIRTAIVGGDKNGFVRGFLTHSHPDFDLVCVIDQNSAQKKILSRILKVPGYQTIVEAINKTPVDLLIFCSRAATNQQNIDVGLAHHTHIFLSHPDCCEYYQSQLMLQRAQKSNIHFMCGHTLQFRPTFMTMQDILNEGYIGNITLLRAALHIRSLIAFSNGQNAVTATQLIRANAKRIFPLLSLILTSQEQVCRIRVQPTVNCSKNSIATVCRFKNGINGVIDFSWLYRQFPQRANYSLIFSGADGMAIAEPNHLSLLFQKKNNRFNAGQYDFHATDIALFAENKHRFWGVYKQMDHIRNAINKGLDTELSWERAHRVIEFIEGMIQSVESGQPIELPLPSKSYSKKKSS